MKKLPDLDQVIAAVAGSDDPLDQLAEAVRIGDQLDDLSESVLDHFVEKAREAGCSWSQIGGVLGVSKQAAQQRHTTTDSLFNRLLGRLQRREGGRRGPFQRFTRRARDSVMGAQDAARRLQHNYIGTEHLLLGILGQPESIAAKVLADAGITEGVVTDAVIADIGRGDSPVKGHIPFTPRAKKVLELSLRESLNLGHNYIGTEHILLGVIREGEGVGARILVDRGVDGDTARTAIQDRLSTADQ